MKRNIIMTVVTFAALAMLSGSLLAKEGEPRGKRRGGEEGKKRVAKRGGGRQRRMPDIGLTEAQKKEIGEIRKAAMAKMKDAKPEERKAIHEQMRKDVHAKLTEEQIAKMKEMHKDGGKGKGGRPDLGLNETQKAKMAEIRKETAAKMKAAKTPEERKTIMAAAREKMEAVMTPEQLEKMKAARKGERPHGKMPEIGLSDAQKTEIQGIRKKAMADAKEAKGEDRKAIMDKMHKDIRALMTDEQIEKLKKAHGGERKKGEGKGREGKGREGKGRKGGRKRPAAE